MPSGIADAIPSRPGPATHKELSLTTMTPTLLNLIAIVLYILAGTLLSFRLSRATADHQPRKDYILAIGLLAVACHLAALYPRPTGSGELNLGFFNVVSLLSAILALLLLVTACLRPVENLGIVILPLAAIAQLLDLTFPSNHLLSPAEEGLKAHIILSITAYSLLSLAALQAILIAIQNRQLHNKRPGGFIRALPPLQTMETLLFQMIAIGFILQTLSLVSGFLYVDNLFAQHLVHKTVLSLIAWCIFAALLWGRWRHGWRGRIAIRWTMWGFVSLLLAYLGSKLVLELILGR